MWFRLALFLGGTVAELQARMSSDEFTLWRAYYAAYPFGYDIDNFRMGSICSAVSNAPHYKTAKPAAPSDFYPAQPNKKPQLTKRQQQQLEKKRRDRSKS